MYHPSSYFDESTKAVKQHMETLEANNEKAGIVAALVLAICGIWMDQPKAFREVQLIESLGILFLLYYTYYTQLLHFLCDLNNRFT